MLKCRIFDAPGVKYGGRPQAIVADTIKGRGVKRMEMSLNWHVGNLVGSDYDEVVAELQAGLAAPDATGAPADDA